MILSYCIWQMYDNFNNIFKQRIHKTFIRKYIIQAIVVPVYVITQLVILCLNFLYLNKLTLYGVDKYYYYCTGGLSVLYIPVIVYFAKRR
ncbi:hypothetical protein ACO0OL_001026 [Hanseniaspora opuntiae]